ncbi:DUF3592 domain-containing protein [Kitasatospora sp. NBC_00240]|uniref:DUF3592 domain-containing protein n=1 Tax=Kitasatospora sp. NBC_00240 TaxID=2903567 RepID=UPI00224F71C5|nr:DUF3592 domain-containing protein [Kitasatospora sp. NBC_00240]MCX5208167.1 DUF3592 domain-containing protein [Kitasatospora sp. NBC_00240]
MDAGRLLPLALLVGMGGAVAYLAGAMGLNRTRRLRRVGVPVQALVRYRPADAGDRTGAGRPLLQFVTVDDAVMEVSSPVPAGRAQPLADGGQVWISYDPAAPREIAVRGRERVWLDGAFIVLGAVAVFLSLALFLLAV